MLGKAASAAIRGLSQAFIVYLLALALAVELSVNPLAIAGVTAFIMLGSALFSTLSLIIACIVKTRFIGIDQVLTMPIFFASNAIYPIALMSGWLRTVARINPLTYQVDALRALMLAGGTSVFGIATDFTVQRSLRLHWLVWRQGSMPLANAEIAGQLEKIADLLDIEGANQFRIRAYRRAARVIGELPHNVVEMLDSGEDLDELPGIGRDLAGKISEIARQGHLPLLDELERKAPPGIAALLAHVSLFCRVGR